MHKFRSFFAVLFVFGVVLGGFGRALCTRSNKNYAEPRSESFVPDVIETVLHDEELRQIYVCYNDANCVNVYSDSGEFLWAVATPYIRNSYFVLQDGKLIVFGIDNFYVYDSADGAFVGREEAVGSDFAYDYENAAVGTTKDGKFCFDAYRVYKINSDGTKTAVVSRPWWHWIFHFAICMCITFVGALGVGITVFAEKAQSYNAVKKAKMENHKAKVMVRYFQITSIVQMAYAVLCIVLKIPDGRLSIGLLPIGVHFIVSNWVFWNLFDSISMTSEEKAVADFWKVFEIATFLAAFLSAAICG